MLHLVYILAFTVIAFFAISNMIRSLITISADSQKGAWTDKPRPVNSSRQAYLQQTHPELLDENGNPINEPLLVIRSVSVEDAKEKLDYLYNASPSQTRQKDEDS